MSDIVYPVVMRLEMDVGFPPDGVFCECCDFCRTDTTNRDRKRCALTHEVLFHPKAARGFMCPLKKKEDKE